MSTASVIALEPFERRFPEGGCRPGSGCSVHAWVVTAPLATPRWSGDRRPWGIAHAKRNGALDTACGLSSASWYSFFGIEFRPYAADACSACARHVAAGCP